MGAGRFPHRRRIPVPVPRHVDAVRVADGALQRPDGRVRCVAVVVGRRDSAGCRRVHHPRCRDAIAAFIGSGSMAVAYFWKHQGDGLLPIANEGDSAALYCWALFLLVFIGSGRPALENVLVRKRAEQSDTAASQDSAVRTAA